MKHIHIMLELPLMPCLRVVVCLELENRRLFLSLSLSLRVCVTLPLESCASRHVNVFLKVYAKRCLSPSHTHAHK